MRSRRRLTAIADWVPGIIRPAGPGRGAHAWNLAAENGQQATGRYPGCLTGALRHYECHIHRHAARAGGDHSHDPGGPVTRGHRSRTGRVYVANFDSNTGICDRDLPEMTQPPARRPVPGRTWRAGTCQPRRLAAVARASRFAQIPLTCKRPAAVLFVQTGEPGAPLRCRSLTGLPAADRLVGSDPAAMALPSSQKPDRRPGDQASDLQFLVAGAGFEPATSGLSARMAVFNPARYLSIAIDRVT
jgi:hypothetical protein